MASGLPLLRFTTRYRPGAGPVLPSVTFSTVSLNVVVPDLLVDSTRYTREPLAGVVKDTVWFTREPSGMVSVVLPEAITAPVGLSSRALQAKPTAVPARSSLKTVMVRFTVVLNGKLTTPGSGKVPFASDTPEADQ